MVMFGRRPSESSRRFSTQVAPSAPLASVSAVFEHTLQPGARCLPDAENRTPFQDKTGPELFAVSAIGEKGAS